MLIRLRSFTKTLPSLLTALLLAIAVWILAVTASDPSEDRVYPNPVPIEVIGQAANMVITSDLPDSISITLRAPSSIWNSLITEKAPVRALIDLSGMKEGEHTIPIQIQVGIKPVEVRSFNPRSISLILEPLQTAQYEIKVVNRGALPVGYQSEQPQLSESVSQVSGAKSRVERVSEVRAVVDLTQVKTDINQVITLQPVDANGVVVKDVSVTPEKITLIQSVAQRGGYQNVIVKVVTEGQITSGFRLTSISVFPPTITVFSTEPSLVDALPGYVETRPISLTGRSDGFEESVDLVLPDGVQVIGSQQVLVSVGISPVESSLALTDVPVQATGLAANLAAQFVPESVNIIISGPLPALEALDIKDVRVLIDLTGVFPGKYTLEPQVSLNVPNLKIESISPTSFEVTVISTSK